MKTPFKCINFLVLTLLLTTMSCNNDDDPVIINLQDLEVTLDENPTNGQAIGTIQSDSNSALTYSITTQSPSGALSINGTTGALTVADASLFDFETNPVITATVAATEASNTAMVTINLINENELAIQDFAVAIDENPTDGQSLGTIQASGEGVLSYSITTQTPAGGLSINANTGELTVIDPNLFDFETNPVITATISVNYAGNSATAIATITLNDVDEIVAQNLTVNIDENPTNGQVIGTLQASASGTLSYAITFQSTAGALTINNSTGELTVADASLFDFETTPSMFATISVNNGTYSVSANATINLNNLNEVGDFKYGGVIFWVDPTSNYSVGMVCTLSNQSNSAAWGCSGVDVPGAYGSDIGTGDTNTTAIEAACITTGTAADITTNLSMNGFNDWFLPSWKEFSEIYANKTIINATVLANGGNIITEEKYWTSTSVASSIAYSFRFWDGLVETEFKNTNIKVRAIRTFSDL